MIKVVLLLMMFFLCLPSFSQDDTGCQAKKSSEIIKIFDDGIVINEPEGL